MGYKNEITRIESELEKLLATDKKSWVKIYELMEEVDVQKLYEGEYRSYTAWVNALAEKAHVHVSLLWNRKKAGKVYAAYEARAKEKGREVPKMADVKASADNFNLIEKIAGNNAQVADQLIDQLLNGGMSRSDLKNAWAAAKAARSKAGKKGVRTNAYDKDLISPEPNEAALKAADMVLAISSNTIELFNSIGVQEVYYNVNKDRVMTEFAVNTGTSHHARRIDVMVMETYTVPSRDKNYELHLHAIEIKVSKADLLGDHKMQEYRDYADYFWIAVPAKLEDAARSVMPDGWGLLTVDDNKHLHVAITAQLHNAVLRDEAIETALIKLL